MTFMPSSNTASNPIAAFQSSMMTLSTGHGNGLKCRFGSEKSGMFLLNGG